MALTTNIVSYWKLDESSGNAADSVASNNLTNNNTVGYAPCLIANGADFGATNTNKYFSIASNLGINGGTVSISMWFKLRNASSDGFFILLGDAGTDSRYQISYDTTPQMIYWRSLPGVGGIAEVYGVALDTTTWHHLVLTYNSGTTAFKGYYDGVEVISTTGSGNGSIGISSEFTVGGSPSIGGQYVESYMDEIGVWSRDLTGAEVTTLYNGGAGLTYPFILGPANVKTVDGLAIASVKTMNGLAIASVKTVNGLA